MRNTDHERFVNRYARSVIRYKARQLSRSSGFRPDEREDLEQELWMTLFSQAYRFDAERASLNTFIDRVLCSAATAILRARNRPKRLEGFLLQSLDTAQAHAELPLESEDEINGIDVAEAVEFALSQMPALVRRACQSVMDGSISSAARELRVARRQIRNLLVIAAEHLERAGLEICNFADSQRAKGVHLSIGGR